MKINIKKSMIVPLLAFAGLTYATINANRFDEKMATERAINKDNSSESDVQRAPDLKFKDENGKTVSLHKLKGKVVFINLWATWCPPCIHEMPSINKLRQNFKDNDDLVFLMVDMDGEIETARKFMEKKKFDLPVHVPNSEIPQELFSGSIPTTIIIDKQNNIVGRQVGGADYMSPKIVESIEGLLNE